MKSANEANWSDWPSVTTTRHIVSCRPFVCCLLPTVARVSGHWRPLATARCSLLICRNRRRFVSLVCSRMFQSLRVSKNPNTQMAHAFRPGCKFESATLNRKELELDEAGRWTHWLIDSRPASESESESQRRANEPELGRDSPGGSVARGRLGRRGSSSRLRGSERQFASQGRRTKQHAFPYLDSSNNELRESIDSSIGAWVTRAKQRRPRAAEINFSSVMLEWK